MFATNILLLAVQLGAVASPSAAPPTPPLKEIGHVHSSMFCTAVRHNVLPAAEALHINDALINRGHAILVKTAKDAAAYAASASPTDAAAAGDPFALEAGANAGSATATGGAGAGSEMDAFQLGNLTQRLAKDLDAVDALLDDPHSFPATPASDDERTLALAKSRIQAVVARQRASLNILSTIVETNAANDLKSRRDVIPYEHCMSCSQTRPFTPVSAPEELAAAARLTHETETTIAPAIAPIVAACR